MTAFRSDTDLALVARSVSKSFGSVRALDDVDIVVRPGAVHALVGENGAGKSTLAKVLAGIERPDSAEMTLGGEGYRPHDRAEARRRGVNMVPQQLSLVGELSLVENLLLVAPQRIARRSAGRALLRETLERARVDVAIDVPTASLSQSHRQLGEIVVALAEGATTLILDEPTASLGPVEVGGLFAHLRGLCETGTAILLITHRLDEVRSVADDVTVLSHGRRVHHGPVEGMSPGRIARLMVGELPEPAPHAARSPGPVVIEARNVTAVSASHAGIRDVSLAVRAGEIVGMAGVAGSGQNTLLDVLAGLRPPTDGEVLLEGAPLSRAVAALRAGVSWIPEERAHGIVPSMSLAQTLTLYGDAVGVRRRPRSAAAVEDTLRRFDVRPPRPGLAAAGLSGGNQQKLLVARELDAAASGDAPRVVLAYGPTQGLDLRAAQAIRERLIAAAEGGAAVLVASHDLEELRGLADRIAVMFGGRIVADLDADVATTDRLGAAMAGLDASEDTGGAHP